VLFHLGHASSLVVGFYLRLFTAINHNFEYDSFTEFFDPSIELASLRDGLRDALPLELVLGE
jgi:hypothetical protein